MKQKVRLNLNKTTKIRKNPTEIRILYMQYINAPNIKLGIANPLNPDNTSDQVILILRYYLYKCRCLGDNPV